LTILTAYVGGVASIQAVTFYRDLVKPKWAPSSKVFGPVWSCLYIMMSIALWQVCQKATGQALYLAVGLFSLQLCLNAIWTWLFFKWRMGAWSVADILALWATLVLLTFHFWSIQPVSAMLMVPYILWVSFASALNISVNRLNPDKLRSVSRAGS
jgi:tryptophan-rich sensory protein